MEESLRERLAAALDGRYAIVSELGQGGMAIVYLADDLRHPRRVAVKVVKPELIPADGDRRFLREIAIAGGLTHPNILPLLDSGNAAGLLYYVMPYVEASSLRELLASRKQLSVEETLQIGIDVAQALEYAHAHDVVHRDIKPENILLSGGHALVADFGIARALIGGESRLTSTGVVLGTPTYMSPEQSLGSDVDARSDLYALACVLYEALAGAPPFTGPTAQSVQARHQFDPVPALRTIRPGVPEALEAALMRALAKVPADRFASAREFAAALKQVPTGTPLSQTSAPSRGASARRKTTAIALAVLALAAVALIVFVRARNHSAPAPSTARDWILVADFDGPANDPDLAAAARELISASLDQSGIVVSVPQDQVRQALRRAGRPDTTRLDAELASELAYRSAIRAVVAGRIQRLGDGYSTVVRVTDAESSKVIFTVDATAHNSKELIPSLERLGRQLRAGLGESREAVRATRPLTEVTTPSFPAYRLMVRAGELIGRGQSEAAVASARAALALDPDFAAAWRSLGIAYLNSGRADSAYDAFTHALRNRDRLEEWRQLDAEAQLALLGGDPASAVAAFDRGLRLSPQNSTLRNNDANALSELGRVAEAADTLQSALRDDPLGPTAVLLTNLHEALTQLDRLDEARAIESRMEPVWQRVAVMSRAVCADQWSTADSVARILSVDPQSTGLVRILSPFVVMSGRIAAGSLTEVTGGPMPPWLMVGVANLAPSRAEGLFTRLRTNSDASPPSLVWNALLASASGDTTRAQHVLRQIQALPELDRTFLGAWTEYVSASLAGSEGRWDETIATLGPYARTGLELRNPTWRMPPIGGTALRWTVADAFEHAGKPDSAAAYFELALATRGAMWVERVRIRTYAPYIHRRLALLYARMGRTEEAERNGQAYFAAMTQPDPELRADIDDLKRVLATSRAMGRPARL
jgi:eukaryotic-like serine/threonine-protein kinase